MKFILLVSLLFFACEEPPPPPVKTEPVRQPEKEVEGSSPTDIHALADWWVVLSAKYSEECVWAEQTRWFEPKDRPVDEKCAKKWRAYVTKVKHKVPTNVRDRVWVAAWNEAKKRDQPFAKGRIAKYVASNESWNPPAVMSVLKETLTRSPNSVDARHAIWAVGGRAEFRPLLRKIVEGKGDNAETANRHLVGAKE